jgi:hypothetical protein
MRMPLAAMFATLLLACAACPFAPAEPESIAPEFAAATPAPIWREVFAGLVRRADRGDAESARLALEMHGLAPRIYGERFDATPAQLQAWHCRAQRREPPCTPPAA